MITIWLYENTEPTAVKEKIAEQPREFSLSQNYPNRFNPTTNISFELKNSSKVNLKVYDLYGRDIITLVNEMKSAGQHNVQFDGTNLSSGVYLYRMAIVNEIFTKKMMLLK